VGGDELFSTDSGDIADSCIDLALVFKCDPFALMDRPAREIEELARRTQKRMRNMRTTD
jgi:hypothetical protein